MRRFSNYFWLPAKRAIRYRAPLTPCAVESESLPCNPYSSEFGIFREGNVLFVVSRHVSLGVSGLVAIAFSGPYAGEILGEVFFQGGQSEEALGSPNWEHWALWYLAKRLADYLDISDPPTEAATVTVEEA